MRDGFLKGVGLASFFERVDPLGVGLASLFERVDSMGFDLPGEEALELR